MRAVKLILVVLTILGMVLGVSYASVKILKPKSSGLFVESNPPSEVFIDGVSAGKTPYEIVRKPGEIVLRLVPEGKIDDPKSYETRITLGAGIKTIVKREFGDSDETSSGEIISFEKIAKDEAALAVISIPDAAQIMVDGLVRGFSPYKTSSISPGDHNLIISSNGYSERTVPIKVVSGYKLTAIIKLPLASDQQLPSPTPKSDLNLPNDMEKTQIEIGKTPTGFLRVRTEPTTTSPEAGRVSPGDKFDLIEESKDGDWYRIEFLKGKEGWVSSQYAKKTEVSSSLSKSKSPSPSPTPKSTPKT